jgi:hypothetical protein
MNRSILPVMIVFNFFSFLVVLPMKSALIIKQLESSDKNFDAMIDAIVADVKKMEKHSEYGQINFFGIAQRLPIRERLCAVVQKESDGTILTAQNSDGHLMGSLMLASGDLLKSLCEKEEQEKAAAHIKTVEDMKISDKGDCLKSVHYCWFSPLTENVKVLEALLEAVQDRFANRLNMIVLETSIASVWIGLLLRSIGRFFITPTCRYYPLRADILVYELHPPHATSPRRLVSQVQIGSVVKGQQQHAQVNQGDAVLQVQVAETLEDCVQTISFE